MNKRYSCTDLQLALVRPAALPSTLTPETPHPSCLDPLENQFFGEVGWLAVDEVELQVPPYQVQDVLHDVWSQLRRDHRRQLVSMRPRAVATLVHLETKLVLHMHIHIYVRPLVAQHALVNYKGPGPLVGALRNIFAAYTAHSM